MMKKRGMLIVISGPSGVGKGTVANRLLEKHDNICFSVSATTRAMREGEAEGVNYFYKTTEEFDTMIEQGEFLEYMRVFGKNYYGTPRSYVESKRSEGISVLLDIDVKVQCTLKQLPRRNNDFHCAPFTGGAAQAACGQRDGDSRSGCPKV